MSGFAEVAYHMRCRYSEAGYTVGLLCQNGGQAEGNAQDVELIPLWEAADNLIRSVADQRRRHLPDTSNNFKIAIVDAVQMSALVPTAEPKQLG